MNVLGCAVNFGLGPVGKLSSIISETNNNTNKIKWYACGDELDKNIFKTNMFVDSCWSKNEEELQNFVNKYNIELAVIVLDPDIAIIMKKIGVPVFYVDSLPFLWTESDLVPFDVDFYFAQKCVNMNERATEIMNKVKNLKWVNPITPNILNKKNTGYNEYDIVINLGGMHSPYGDGEEYIKIVVVNLLEILLSKYKNKKTIITCGSKAKKAIQKILEEKNLSDVKVETLKQEDFSITVNNCELFITSPGMTTIYETCNYDKDTIMLPPQNLSQFYNIEFSKELIKRLKVIEWDRSDLELRYLSDYLNLGEEKVVEIIYTNIKKASNDFEYQKRLKENIKEIFDKEFIDRQVIRFEESGTDQIVKEILRKGEN